MIAPGRGDLEFHYTGPLLHRSGSRQLPLHARGLRPRVDRGRLPARRRSTRTSRRASTPSASRPATTTVCGTRRARSCASRCGRTSSRPPGSTGLCARGTGAGGVRRRAPAGRPGPSARERELEQLVAERTLQLEEANAKLQQLSELDALTAIANRRRFEETLAREWRRATRDELPLSLDHDRHRLLQGLQRRQRPPARRPVPAARGRRDPRGLDASGRPRRPLRGRGVRGDPAVDAQSRRRAPWRSCCGPRVERMATRHRASPFGVVTISLGVATAIAGGDLPPRSPWSPRPTKRSTAPSEPARNRVEAGDFVKAG